MENNKFISAEEFLSRSTKNARNKNELFIGSIFNDKNQVEDLINQIKVNNGVCYFVDNTYQSNFSDTLRVDMTNCSKEQVIHIMSFIGYRCDEIDVCQNNANVVDFWWD